MNSCYRQVKIAQKLHYLFGQVSGTIRIIP